MIGNLRKHLVRGGIFESMATVLTGTLAAQILSIISLPVLSRVYDDHAFGRLQLYVTILNVLLMVVTLRYEVALLSVSKGWSLRNLLKLLLRICLVMTCLLVLVLIGIYLFRKGFPTELGSIFYLLPLGMLLGGLFQTCSFLPIRDRNYRLSAGSKVAQSGAYAITGVVAAFTPVGALGLIFADIAGRLLGIFVVVRGSKFMPLREILTQTWPAMKTALYRFRKFPYFTLPGTTLSATVSALPAALLVGLFDLGIAGQYALIDRFVLVPIGTIGYAVTQVFTGESAAKFRSNPSEMNKTFRRTVCMLAAVAIIPCTLGYFAAPTVIPFIFGDQWHLAGKMGSLLMLVVFSSFVASPVNMVLIICNQQKVQFAWDVGRFIAYSTAFAIMWHLKVESPLTVVAVYAVLLFLSYAVHLVLVDRVTDKMQS